MHPKKSIDAESYQSLATMVGTHGLDQHLYYPYPPFHQITTPRTTVSQTFRLHPTCLKNAKFDWISQWLSWLNSNSVNLFKPARPTCRLPINDAIPGVRPQVSTRAHVPGGKGAWHRQIVWSRIWMEKSLEVWAAIFSLSPIFPAGLSLAARFRP